VTVAVAAVIALIFGPVDSAWAAAGDILVVDETCCTTLNGGVIRVTPASGAQAIVSEAGNFQSPAGIALDAEGSLLVVDGTCCSGGNGAVIRVNPANGSQTIVSQGDKFRNPVAVAVDVNGDIYVADYACCSGGKGGVIRVNPTNGAQTIVSEGNNFARPSGIAIESTGNLLVVDLKCCNGAKGGVIRVNPANGSQSIVSQGGNFARPFGIAIEANGDILVSDSDCCQGTGGGVIRVNPTNGAQSIVSQGGNFSAVGGVAIAADSSIAVTDADCLVGDAGVIRVSQANGAQTLVSPTGAVTNRMVVPPGLAIEPHPPTVTTSAGAIGYTTPLSTIVIDPGLSLVDPNLPKLLTATVQISSGYVNGQDVLSFTPSGGITGGFNAATGTLTLTGGRTLSDFQNVLRSVTYRNISGAPGTVNRTVTFTLKDKGAVGSANRQIGLGAPTPTISATMGPFATTPAGATQIVDVSLSNASGNVASVNFATANGTATAGVHYVATSGTLTFQPGETTKSITIQILPQGLIDGVRTLLLVLSNPTNATVPNPTTTVSIRGTEQVFEKIEEKDERLTEQEKLQRTRTNTGSRDDETIEGDVLSVETEPSTPATIVIANRDGRVTLVLLCRDGCANARPGNYVKADGWKENEGLFWVDSLKIVK
jgi:sugar lactone lactonase YvrE